MTAKNGDPLLADSAAAAPAALSRNCAPPLMPVSDTAEDI